MKSMNFSRVGIKSLCVTAFIVMLGCSDSGIIDNVTDPSATPIEDAVNYTGNEVSFELISASDFDMSGTVTLKERKDKTADVVIKLTGTTGSSAQFPVHLHMGDVSRPDANVAAWLNPVSDATGLSKTNVKHLVDESAISYDELSKLSACIKIHLPYPEGATVVLAAGNIGSAKTKLNSFGRVDIAICRGN